MAHLLRGKQAGVQRDLSAGISPEFFALDDFARYGVNSQISTLAYDPILLLLAVGTNDSKFGPGLIYVYGQNRVCSTFNTPRRSSIRQLHFCADKLISLDSKNDVSVFSLQTGRTLASYAPPGNASTLFVDPSMDYCFIGLQNGEVIAYDLDRATLTPFRIPNLWREINPRARILPVVSLQIHPRDVGTFLIGYSEGAVLFSFKQNKPVKTFQYIIPQGAPGGEPDLAGPHEVRRPRLTHAVWHPTGTFILTAHEDSSLVLWDPRDGRIIEARTIDTTRVHLPGGGTSTNRGSGATNSMKMPFFDIAWCSKENPDDTGILIAGGIPTVTPTPGLTFFDLGQSPNYQSSSWDVLAKHFQQPRRTHILPTPPGSEVVKLLLIPRTSPHFAGSHDPIAVIALLSSGELVTMSFPSGFPITPTNQLPVSLSFVHPFVNKTTLACIDRTRWLGSTETRQQGPKFVMGGAGEIKTLKRHENRNIIQTAHADGTVRLWDAGHGDQIENSAVIQADLAKAVGRFENLEVSQMSMSGAIGELSVGLRSGEVVVFRMNRNPNFGREPPPPRPNERPGVLTNISERTDPELKEGMIPLTLLNEQQGSVTALRHSDVGFVAAGFDSGAIAVVDLRGPAIIHTQLLSEQASKSKRGSIRRSNSQVSSQAEVAILIEFGVMTLDGDDYSSILMFVGTSSGRVLTFKILPASNGTYSVAFTGSASLDSRIISICPINADSGHPASATQSAVAALKSGTRTNGALVVTTSSSLHVFKPASARGAHKNFDEFFCHAACVSRFTDRGFALVGLFGDGQARAYSIPGLKEIGHARINHVLDVKRFPDATITPTGDILGWTGPSEMALLNVWGTGQAIPPSRDMLYNPDSVIPPRPTISNLQWISGTQHVTPADMDFLIGGPDRPPSKRMLSEMREAESAQRAAGARGGRPPPPGQAGSGAGAGGGDEGYWAYMQRQVQERTEKLGMTSDNMDRLEENSSGWATDVSKYVQKQKRNVVMGAIGSKFGL